ncbi:hypothetical protein [Prochlorococcus marinus]|nr:hypothetical protein [Prochlorococcus marinus]
MRLAIPDPPQRRDLRVNIYVLLNPNAEDALRFYVPDVSQQMS